MNKWRFSNAKAGKVRCYEFTKQRETLAALGLHFFWPVVSKESIAEGTVMIKKHSQSWIWRGSGAIVVATLALPLVGCGSNAPAPTNSAPSVNTQSRPSMGLSTKQKVVLLAGAAALYYYYNKSKKATAAKYGQQVQYYRSKNGRIYYRDPQNPQKVNWVTPPPNNYTQSVQANEAQQYSDYQGFNNANTGKTLEDAFPVR